MFGIDDLIAGGVALGFQAYGAYEQGQGADKYTNAEKTKINLEQQVEEQRRKAMELDASRKQIENIRQVQKATALARVAAVGGGSELGSGLAGGKAQIAGQGAWNALGIQQNLQIGETTFDLNAQIGQQKIVQAEANKQIQEGQAWSKLGGQIGQSAKPLANILGAFGPKTS